MINHYLAMDAGGVSETVPGIATVEPCLWTERPVG